MMVPEWITPAAFGAAVAAGNRPERLDDVLARMHEQFIPGEGLQMSGRHHEIYLSDARTTEPARLRIILRQPVVPSSNKEDT